MTKELPSWALPTAVALGVLLIGIIVWRTLTGHNAPVGKDIAVRPGTYDYKVEMQKPRKQAPGTGAPLQ